MNFSKLTTLALTLVMCGSFANAAKSACQFSDAAKLKTHLEAHVTYPTNGKALKAACKKEWPDEFSKKEQACMTKAINDKAEFKTSGEVMAALGLK